MSQATPLVPGAAASSTIETSSDKDYWSFSLSRRQQPTIDLTNLPWNYSLKLIDSSGSALAYSTQDGINPERITAVLEAGTYWVVVYAAGSDYSASLPYTLKISALVDVPLDGAGNQSNLATPLVPGTTVFDTIETDEDVDWWSFDVSGRQFATVDLTDLPGNYNLSLYGPDGQIGSSSLSGTSPERVTALLLPGSYKVRVQSYSTWSGDSDWFDTYALTVGLRAVPDDVAGNQSNLAAALVPGTPVADTIDSASDVDWWTFSVAVRSTLAVDLTGLPADYGFEVYGNPTSSGRLMSSNQPALTQERATGTVDPGQYFVAVYGTDDQYDLWAPYTLTVAATQIAPETAPVATVTYPRSRGARISWPAVNGATSYSYRISKPNRTGAFKKWRSLTASTMTIRKIVPGARYRLQLAAVNPAGTGPVAQVRIKRPR